MTVKEFIPIADVKKTVEKKVRPRLSTAELTTIERPGSPYPEKLSDIPKKKPVRKRKFSKKPPTNISKPNKNSILIITEKPSAAEKIAFALGPARKIREGKVSYFELSRNNENILVASAVGHLYNLNAKGGAKGWPLFDLAWEPAHLKKGSAFTKPYLSVLKKLSLRAKELVIATDFDIEGEVIGWNVVRFAAGKETAKRMKFSTLTKDELEKSFDELLPSPHWGHAFAGETRHILDWLYGINLSRGLMAAIKTSGAFKLLSIGRVQGPALKIIVDREREINNFKPVPFWEAYAKSNGIDFKHPKDIFEKNHLAHFEGIDRAVAATKEKSENILPPVPFDLTTLQREAYRHLGMSPSATLKVAQKLYLEGLISYPRTSSQKIPAAINPKKILSLLSRAYAKETKLAIRQRPVEGKKTDPAHPSIFPTGNTKKLEGQPQKLYDLIARRFIGTFAADAKTQRRNVTLISDKLDHEGKPISFTANGLKINEKGWMEVYPSVLKESSIHVINGEVKIDSLAFPQKETQPPKRFTPTSLITILERKNLGTKATRSNIVDTLFNRGYLDGKSIKATHLGMTLISALEEHSPIIIDENLTRAFEDELEQFNTVDDPVSLKLKEDETVEKAKRAISDIAKEFKSKEIAIGKSLAEGLNSVRRTEQEESVLCKCPTCNKGNIRITYSKKTKRFFAACNAFPKCTQTYSFPPSQSIKKSGEDCPSCKFPLVVAINRGRRPWKFCFNSECEVVKKRILEFNAKRTNKASRFSR